MLGYIMLLRPSFSDDLAPRHSDAVLLSLITYVPQDYEDKQCRKVKSLISGKRSL